MSARTGPAPPEGSTTSGDVLFARYAYPPNQLGYCGPGDGRELLELASGGGNGGGGDEVGGDEVGGDEVGGDEVGGDGVGMAERARAFDGAWPYLQIIAAATGIDDPLDRRVVEAYWVGNEFLDAVDPAAFAREARQTFGHQTGADWACLEPPTTVTPHHSFHVFAIYPWMGLLRRAAPGPALTVLDRCRIRWGQVVRAHGDHVDVRSEPLTWDGTTVGLGASAIETARWADSGRSLAAPPAAGEWVALHWDWVCDRLTAPQLAALRRFTLDQLDITNRRAGGPTMTAGGR